MATIGPAIGSPDKLIKALEAGVDVCRVNCSHCKVVMTSDEILQMFVVLVLLWEDQLLYSWICRVEDQNWRNRTPLPLENGDILTVVMDKNYVHHDRKIGTTWPTMAEDVEVNEKYCLPMVNYKESFVTFDMVMIQPLQRWISE